MLQLSGGVGLGVNIAYLLCLQAALKTDGIVESAAHEEDVLRAGELGGEPLDALLFLQDPGDLVRKSGELLKIIAIRLTVDLSLYVRKLDSQRIDRDQLRGIRLCRRNRDLGAGMRIQDMIGLMRYGRADHIHDSEGPHPHAFRLSKSGKAVSRFSGLGNDNE